MPSVQSIDRAFLLLDRLASGELGVTELAIQTDLPKSTVARLLQTLVGLGAVERNANTGRYRIGAKISSLAGAAEPGSHLVPRARPLLSMLAREVGENAGLSVPDGYRVRYIDQVDSDNAVQVRNWTGELIAMHVVSAGLVMLAQWPGERIERYLQRPLESWTINSMTDPDPLRERLAAIRDEGHAWVFEEFAEGINSVAAPVLDGKQRAVGAIHIHGPAYRFPNASDRSAITAVVIEAAGSLSTVQRTQR